jgi:hypothetical protein
MPWHLDPLYLPPIAAPRRYINGLQAFTVSSIDTEEIKTDVKVKMEIGGFGEEVEGGWGGDEQV